MADTVGRENAEWHREPPVEEPKPAPQEIEPLNLLETLLEEAGADQAEETFTIYAGRGQHPIEAKVVRDADALNKIFRRARALSKKTTANTPPSWHPFLPISTGTAEGMAFMEAMLVSPKWSHLEMLKLAKLAGGYFLQISMELKQKAFNVQIQADADEIDAEGND